MTTIKGYYKNRYKNLDSFLNFKLGLYNKFVEAKEKDLLNS